MGYLAILVCALLLIARCFYGFDWTDESFYLSTVNRLYQGDALIVDEWHPAQLFSAITLPLYCAYRAIAGSPDGAYLCFRILYVLLSTLTACLLFRAFAARKNGFCALLMALTVMIVTNGPSTLSYNCMGLQFCSLGCLCLYRGCQQGARGRLPAIGFGVCYALAVLCFPYLAAVFVLAVAALAALACLGVHGARRGLLFFLSSIRGVLLILIPFLVYFLRTVPLPQMGVSLRYVFMDPVHAKIDYTADILRQGMRALRLYRIGMAIVAAVAMWLLVKRLRGFRLWAWERPALLMLTVLCTAYGFWRAGAPLDWVMPLVALGLVCYLLADARDNALLLTFYVPGIVLGLVWYISSDTGSRALNYGMMSAALASILLLGDALKEIAGKLPRPGRAALRFAALLVAVAFVVRMGYARTEVYRDGALAECTVRLEDGPGKGIYTRPLAAERYDQMLTMARECAGGDGALLIMPFAPWLYLVSDMRCGMPTTWRMFDDDPRFEPYYTLHPDRLPDVLIAPNEDWIEYRARGSNPYIPLFSSHGFLQRRLNVQEYEVRRTPAAAVYIRRGYEQRPSRTS